MAGDKAWSDPKPEDVLRYADMFAAVGTEPRLRIMRALLSAHPDGMIVGNIQAHGLDVDAIAPLVREKFMSAFVRARKPAVV